MLPPLRKVPSLAKGHATTRRQSQAGKSSGDKARGQEAGPLSFKREGGDEHPPIRPKEGLSSQQAASLVEITSQNGSTGGRKTSSSSRANLKNSAAIQSSWSALDAEAGLDPFLGLSLSHFM